MAKITKAIKGGLEYSLGAENGFEPGTGTTGQILVKTASGYAWIDLADLGIIVKDGASPLNVTKVWAGEETDYQGLSNYDDETIYHTV